MHLGALSRGFLHEASRLVVVTDAEIFGRYKVQRPRRLKSPHAQAARSALDIDFTDLEEGDFVVHLQHGIGRYLGLKILPVSAGANTQPTLTPHRRTIPARNVSSSNTRPAIPTSRRSFTFRSPKRISSANMSARAKPVRRLNTLGGTRWAKAKEQAETAVRDVAAELLRIQAARESQPGHAFQAATRTGSANLKAHLSTRKRRDQITRHRRNQVRHGTAQADGSADLRRCRFRQNRSRHPRRIQGGDGRQTSRRSSCPRPCWRSNISIISASAWRIIRCAWNCSRASARTREQRTVVKDLRGGRGGYRHRHASPGAEGHRVQGPGPGGD